MLSCEWAAGGINFCSLSGRHLVLGEVTPHQLSHHYRDDCRCTEFLRKLGRGKGRVQNLNSNPKVCHTNFLIPESQVALVETSISPRIGSDFVPTLRVGIRILYPNLGCGRIGSTSSRDSTAQLRPPEAVICEGCVLSGGESSLLGTNPTLSHYLPPLSIRSFSLFYFTCAHTRITQLWR